MKSLDSAATREPKGAKRTPFLNWILLKFVGNRAVSLLVLIVLVSIVMGILFPRSYLSLTNLGAVLLSLSVDGILAIGMMYLLISGVFDISVGSNAAVGGAVAALMMKKAGLPVPLSMLGGVAVSTLAGFVNGIIVEKLGVNAFVATLAMLGILRGVAILIAGAGIVQLPEAFLHFGQKVVFGLQLPVYYLIGLGVVFGIVLAKTRFFRQLYFIGGNRRAAELSGINVSATMVVTFALMGALAGFAGVTIAARLNAAIGTIAQGVELRVIAAVVVGGGSLKGGRGTVAGAIMGALFMGVVNNVMVIAGINVYWQSIVVGIVLLLAVTMDVVVQRKFGGQ